MRLLDDALEYDPTLEQYRDVCKLATDFYFGGRYPLELGYPEPPDMSDENVRAALAEIAPLIERLRAGSARVDIDEQGG